MTEVQRERQIHSMLGKYSYISNQLIYKQK